MKKFFTLCGLLLSAALVFGQGSITGTVIDGSTEEPLIGATVLVKGTMSGTVTDFDGQFTLADLSPGNYTITFSYTGYATIEKEVSVNGKTDIGVVEMGYESVALQGVEVIASVARDRRTPIAVSTLTGETVSALVGNQEYPEILRRTPSVYVTKQGGGFGDSRINVRGFDQRNTAVMINGIPVNDMENGWVYWSNWAGLSDVTSKLQIQRGLGASKLAVASVGGSINIITNAADFDKGGSASVSIGNDGFQKYGVVFSTGLGDNGWAFTAQATHTRGDGYVDGTMFRAYSYFASLSKIFNSKHSIGITALGAPQWHHQRLFASRFDNITLRTFVDPDNLEAEEGDKYNQGIRFNNTWGTLNGEEFNWRRNFYHKPKAFINHYWNISDKTDLKTSAYVSLGRGGGTGPRGRIRTGNWSGFDSFSGFGEGIHNQDGQVRFDDIVRYNQGQEVEGFGQKEQYEGEYVVANRGQINGDNAGSGFIRRASMNSHNWYGVLSTLTTKLSNNLNLVAGVDGRYYKGIHYRRVENLLGADAYFSAGDINFPNNIIRETVPAEFGSFADNTHNPGQNVINYYNDGLVNWLGLFGQLEYTNDKLSTFVALSGSNQGFKRIDYFNYEEKDTPDNDINNDGEFRETDWQNFLGGTVKAGLNYNINSQHNVYFNGGYFSRQPLFDNVFLNFRNVVNTDLQNQSVVALEAGYGFRSVNFNAKVNVYHTEWGNRQFDRTFRDYQYVFGGDTLLVEALAIFENVAQTHQGVEVELNYSPIRNLSFNGMLSLGNWRFTQNFNATLTDTDNNRPIGEEVSLDTEGLKVGDAAQTTFGIGFNWGIARGLNFYGDYFYFDNLYADWNIQDGIPEQVAKLPAYGLLDAGLSYNFDIKGGTNCTVRFNMNNVLDEIYVSELETSIADNPDTPSRNEFYDNRGIFGFGRTWNAGLKIRF
ncbi:MAG: TonB-dependent receptor [Bacteroidetes bacterium]|nr:MAG: TonB-dependent receptor [Bacteroidota bacterium]